MGSSSSLVMLLRRIGRGALQIGMDDGSGGALDGDDVEEDDDGPRGGVPSSINDEDGQVREAVGMDDGGMGRASASASNPPSTTTSSRQGGQGELDIAFTVNTYQSGVTCFMSCTYHYFFTTVL
jgi:hypothetical protein